MAAHSVAAQMTPPDHRRAPLAERFSTPWRGRSFNRRVSGAVGAAALAAVAAGACASGSTEPDADATLRIYVSLPLSGPTAADGQDAADGAELALADVGAEAGGVVVETVVLDDAEGEGKTAGWTPVAAAANARAAISDSTAIAYLGDLESGATRASLPITNEARLLQVSPASSAEDLVAPFVGSDELPEVQASTGRTFGRVIPGDSAQGAAGGAWARELGWRRTRVEKDGSEFGEVLAEAFEDEVAVVEGRGARGTFGGYFAGSPERFGELQDDVIVSSTEGPLQMASDAFLPPYSDDLGAGLIGPTYVTSAALDPAHLPAAGKDFLADFEAEYGRAPGRYAAYGYEAMAVVLDSIDRASDPADRDAVIEAFFDTIDRESILGTYSIDQVGETTLDRISGYELRGRKNLTRFRPRPVAELEVP